MAKTGTTNRPITKNSTRLNKIKRIERHLRMHGADKQAVKAVDNLSR